MLLPMNEGDAVGNRPWRIWVSGQYDFRQMPFISMPFTKIAAPVCFLFKKMSFSSPVSYSHLWRSKWNTPVTLFLCAVSVVRMAMIKNWRSSSMI